MNKSAKGINYGKWGFIVGTPIALVSAIATVVAVPDIGCRVGLNSPSCAVPLKDVELLTQSETGEFLDKVRIQFMAKGAPEVQYTDDNGYAKVKMPSRGDVRVNLRKNGYPVQEFIINLENPDPPLRVIKFSKSGQPQVTSTPVSTATSSSPPSSTLPIPSSSPTNSQTPTFTQSNKGILFQLKSCRREDEILKCDFLVIDQKENRKLTIYASYPRLQSRIVDPQGNQYIAKNVEFGGAENNSNVQENLVQGIGLKASITFEKVPIQINQLALFEISAWTQSQNKFTVQFRDVPISN